MGKSPDLRSIQALAQIRDSELPDNVAVEKVAEQVLEYVSIQSLPFLKRWLDSDVNEQRWLFKLLNNLKLLKELPATTDFVAYTCAASSAIAMSNDFATSQVRIPFCSKGYADSLNRAIYRYSMNTCPRVLSTQCQTLR